MNTHGRTYRGHMRTHQRGYKWLQGRTDHKLWDVTKTRNEEWGTGNHPKFNPNPNRNHNPNSNCNPNSNPNPNLSARV